MFFTKKTRVNVPLDHGTIYGLGNWQKYHKWYLLTASDTIDYKVDVIGEDPIYNLVGNPVVVSYLIF